MLKPLEDISVALEQSGLQVRLEKINAAGVETEKLYLLLWRDDQHRDVILEMMFLDEITASMIEDEDEDEDEDDVTLLHFNILLPFKVSTEAMSEAMRVAFFINRLMPVGAVGCSEADGAFYLSYQLALAEPALPALVLQEVINMLSFAAETYGPTLEAAARGELSADELNDQLRSSGNELPPIGDPEKLRPRRH